MASSRMTEYLIEAIRGFITFAIVGGERNKHGASPGSDLGFGIHFELLFACRIVKYRFA
jgi:hypothetical protein